MFKTRESSFKMTESGSPQDHSRCARRTNGLAPEAPERGQLVLVTGGAGYIGSVLTRRLLDRGYRVRLLDRLYWGRKPLENVLDQLEIIEADVRDMPATALDGVDGVIHLAGLSNDPTAEYDPQANWQMNAIATETLGQRCVDREVERLVFASSCSLYDGLPPGMHDETAPIEPRGAYASSKRYGEVALQGLVGEGLCPVIFRNGTVYGYSPRMRFDLVVNTFVKDALLKGELSLHGGGWMWRPLVDVKDVADAMIAGLEAPAEKVRGEIFNVLHSNYQIRELAMLVAGSVQMLGRSVTLAEYPAPKLTRDYECSNTKLASTLGFQPSRSVVEAISEILASIDVDPTNLSDSASLQHPVAGAPPRADAADRSVQGCALSQRVLITGGGGQLASDLEALLSSSAEVRALGRTQLDITADEAVDAVFGEFAPTVVYNCAAFHNVEVCEQEEDRAFEVNARAVKRLAERTTAIGARLVHFSTNYVFDGLAAEPYDEFARPNPRSVYALSKLAGEYAALAYSPDALVVRTGGLYGLHGSASKGGNFVTRMISRARAQGALRVVADQRLSPTFTADLAAAVIDAVDAERSGLVHITNADETSWHGFTEEIMRLAGVPVEVEAVETVRAPGNADRPLNGVLTSVRELEPLRPWDEALSDYLGRARLLAASRT